MRGAGGAACKGAVLDLITQLVRGACGAACKDAFLGPAVQSVLGAGLMHPWSSAGLKKMQSVRVQVMQSVRVQGMHAVLGEFGEQTLLECSGLN